MQRFTVFLFAIPFALMGCATSETALQEQGLKPINASQAKGLLADNTLIAQTAKGNAFTVLYRADGTSTSISGSSSDAGTWEATEEGYICNHWTTWMQP